MKRLSVLTAVFVATGFAAPALADGINLKGPHYNLNIIGVENPKTAPMTDSERHTIFVGLGRKSSVTSNIYLVPGPLASATAMPLMLLIPALGTSSRTRALSSSSPATAPSRQTRAAPAALSPRTIKSGGARSANRAAASP